jgi:hypothetical protein
MRSAHLWVGFGELAACIESGGFRSRNEQAAQAIIQGAVFVDFFPVVFSFIRSIY